MAQITGKAFDTKIFSRVMVYAKPYMGVLYQALLLTVFLAVLGVLRPYLIGKAVDEYVVAGDSQGLLTLTLIIVGVLFLEAFMQFYQTYYSNWLGQSVTIDIRSQIFSHITSFKLKYFDKTAIGTLVTRCISDIETIAQIFSQGLLSIMGELLKLTAVIIFMFWVSWKLTLYSLAPIPFLIIAMIVFKNAIKKAFQEVRTQVSKLNAFVQEHITGMSIVQIFNREGREKAKFIAINDEHKKAHIKSVWAYSIFFPVVEILSAISLAFLVWWGIGGVLKNEVTQGDLVMFILLIYMLFRPIRQLADRFNVLQMGMVGSERVFKVLDTQEQIQDGGTLESGIKGNIKFENVWFAYNEEEWVLKDVSFEAKEGETIAFVGATGAGKSSIVNLVNRFYEFQKGEIRIDQTPIRDYRLDYLRKEIAVVLQDVFLFSASISENITLQNSRISQEEIALAAKAVGADKFIEKLPGGYDYDVKERGGMLSVGQRQLISFIRAYVYNPKVLILDEATSSVDTESEQLIQGAIETLTENRTSIIIAHRLSTIQKADKIIVIEKGGIVEQGNHQELLAKNGHYKRLFDLQFKESELS
ncbi:MAG: ABC transporter ATP-binding protein/permease [Flavobacteriales bacterium]|nr:ABC transporter ATP-binding protein/permease [Flavobacteriales bacterium]